MELSKLQNNTLIVISLLGLLSMGIIFGGIMATYETKTHLKSFSECSANGRYDTLLAKTKLNLSDYDAFMMATSRFQVCIDNLQRAIQP